jgi:hypothetical protein
VTELAFESLDYDEAVARLRENGIERIHRLEIPHGPCASFHVADGSASRSTSSRGPRRPRASTAASMSSR